MTDTLAAKLEVLRERGEPIDPSPRRRAEYAYDASNYRVLPGGVAFPANTADVVRLVAACRADAIPVTVRGGGTSMAGNAVGPGLVLDLSRHLTRILHVDAAAGTVTVEAGAVLADVDAAVRAATGGRFQFAPDPSSRTRATVGGSIGNDACGNRSVAYGRMSDHVLELEVVTSDGCRVVLARGGARAVDATDERAVRRAGELERELHELAARHLARLRTELDRIPRQVSGFHLAHLLPERGFDLARALAGSEGTCAVVVGATLRIVPVPGATALACVGYDDIVDAARDVPRILAAKPTAVEGIDEAIVATMRHRRGDESVTALPAGRAWLYVEVPGDDDEAALEAAGRLADDLARSGRAVDARIVTAPAERATLWRIREDGAGLAARLRGTEESWPGWEDSAVAPERLADYLVDLRELIARSGLDGVMYGHFGAGCVHIRLTFDQRTAEGRAVMAGFLRAAAELVVRHGGSLSGEHGDGRARSALLPLMYSPAVLGAFREFKRAWDPEGILNPGVLVDPDEPGAHLALDGVPVREWRQPLALTHARAGSGPAAFADAAQACVGVGRCRSHTGGVMCPSFRATRDEKDSTRGRARVLQEMIRTAPSERAGWRSPEVAEALDLCLSCKACSTDCPVGVDMAAMKSSFLAEHYRGRLRPRSHYSLGWLPRWLPLASLVAPLVNAVLASPWRRAAARVAGITTQRALPAFARRAHLRRVLAGLPASDGADVVIVADSFTTGFRPEILGAAARVAADAGHGAECRTDVCCGLTLTSTGQLDAARRRLARAAERLDDGTHRPIVVLEPSCAAAFRGDLPELVATDAARRVAGRVRSFAAYVSELAATGWRPPVGTVPASVTLQSHCHEYATFGPSVQRGVLDALGVGGVDEAIGCCGVAGNFGFEPDKFELSMAVAEQALAPALARRAEGSPVLADGFSCRLQIRQLRPDLAPQHLAELLDPGKDGTS